VVEMIWEHFPQKTSSLPNFCIQYPNVVFFGVLEPYFTCQPKNQWKFDQSNNTPLVPLKPSQSSWFLIFAGRIWDDSSGTKGVVTKHNSG